MMKHLRHLLPICFARRLFSVVFALGLASPMAALADMDEVMRATLDGQTAEVIVKLRQDNALPGWRDNATVREQRDAVASAMDDVAPVLRELGIAVDTQFETLPYVGVTVDRAQTVRLLERSEVAGIFLNARERKAQSVQTLSSGVERALAASSVPSIDVAEAWARGFEGKDVTVAVIDGGFRTSHPMLAGKTVAEACFSAHDPATSTFTQCPSGQTPEIAAGAASKCPAGSTRCDHGTHVASVAVGNDGTNFGVARAAKLLPIDVFSEVRAKADCDPDPSPCELTDSLSVLKALDHVNQVAAQFNVVAVNLSLGGNSFEGNCDTDPRREVIEMLRAKGIAVAVASGNEGQTGKINTPACINAAVAVGATNDGTGVASFTNLSSAVDLMAPGVSITAASGQNNGLATFSGTSTAAPHVAGAFAIVRAALPGKSINDIEQALRTTGIKVSRVDTNLVLSKIQVNKALLRLQGRDRRNVNNVLSSNRAATQGQAFLRFQNDSNQTGSVTVSLRDADSGRTLGTWTSPNIAPNASSQVDIANLEKEAKAATQNVPVTDAARTFFNVEVESTVPGYIQHVVLARGASVLANLTACTDGLSNDARTMMYVHSVNIEGYPSRLRIVNTGSAASIGGLVFYNAATGKEIGRYATPEIPAGGSIEIPIARIEAAVSGLQDTSANNGNPILSYNIRLEALAGYMQHIVENSRAGVLLDMSPKCDVGLR